jgi:hypothetical protein
LAICHAQIEQLARFLLSSIQGMQKKIADDKVLKLLLQFKANPLLEGFS